VIFVGTKGEGECWYGCPGGPDVPWEQCEGQRGFWSTKLVGRIIFYDPNDLAAVAAGTKAFSDPQPYATMDIDDVLFAHRPDARQHFHTGGCAYDRARGFLYVFEPLADGDKPLVHVWQAAGSSSGAAPASAPVRDSPVSEIERLLLKLRAAVAPAASASSPRP
jgi:hypothetical protein